MRKYVVTKKETDQKSGLGAGWDWCLAQGHLNRMEGLKPNQFVSARHLWPEPQAELRETQMSHEENKTTVPLSIT